MVPVSVLPAAGLLVALGRVLQNRQSEVLINLGKVFYSGGLSIFEQLPLIFAIGVAIGFTQGAGVAALAGAAGYFTMLNVLKVMQQVLHVGQEINLGVFGGIIIGLIAAKTYSRFSRTELPQVLGFFSGKRLVPILTAAFSLAAGLLLSLVWPPLQEMINHAGLSLMNSDLGPAFYAAGKRLLIPVGLHHVYYPPFLFQFGEFVNSAGQVVHGESARYFAGDPTAGKIMASEFPLMLFGLPAAAMAMYLRAPQEKRKMIGGVMLSAALTSILTGITEPIEFAFTFVAPVLFVLHVALAFISGLLTNFFDIHQGYTFSASLIDFVLGSFNQKNGLILFTVVGPAMFLAYFTSFFWAIGKWNFKTPGREAEDVVKDEDVHEKSTLAENILRALGGSYNILQLDACITRLRVSVRQVEKVQEQALKNLGAAGILKTKGGGVQVIFGTRSEKIREDIAHLMKSPARTLFSPVQGRVLPLSEVPDDTFKNKILGDGVAFMPSEGKLYSPVSGTVATVFKTNHAVGIIADSGEEILLHVGIDTVTMNGRGFRACVTEGDKVEAGQPLLEFDLDLIEQAGKSALTPMIMTSGDQDFRVTKWGAVNVGDELIHL